MYLRVQSMDDSSEVAMDESTDIEVIGRSFIRYAIVDIEFMFRKLHDLPEKQGRSGEALSSLTPRSTRTIAQENSLSIDPVAINTTNSPIDENKESDILQLVRQLKALRKLEERLNFKLSVVEKIQYDLDECLAWQTNLRTAMRVFARRQYAMIVLIKEKCSILHDRNHDSPFSNMSEKLEVKIPKLANEEFIKNNPSKVPQLLVNFDSIKAKRTTIGETLYENVDETRFDSDFETFGSDLEGIMVLSRKLYEYKKLIKLQHLYLVNAGKYLNLKEKSSRRIFTDRNDKGNLKEFDDICDRYYRVMKKTTTPPDFVILNKEIFIKDKEIETVKSNAVPEAETSNKVDSNPVTDANNNGSARKRSVVRSIFELIESKLIGIREDFREFWSECDEVTKNPKNKKIFQDLSSDDVIRKRHGDLSFDEEAVRSGKEVEENENENEAGNADRIDDVEAEEPAEENADQDIDKAKESDNVSATKESDNASETNVGSSDVTSELGELLKEEEKDESGQYLAVFRRLLAFLDTCSKPASPSNIALLDMGTTEFIPEYIKLYNEGSLDFPIDEYYDELDMMMKLMAKFLDEVASIVYSRTTFEIKLLNSSRNVIDKVKGATSLRIVFVEDDDIVDGMQDDGDDDGPDDVVVETEAFGEDFSYLEDENKEEEEQERHRLPDDLSSLSKD